MDATSTSFHLLLLAGLGTFAVSKLLFGLIPATAACCEKAGKNCE